MNERDLRFRTRAIREGQQRTPEQEHCEPIFATSSFVFDSAEQAAARFSGQVPGNLYSRFTNPTVRCFEQRLASLEQGNWCVATASGMAAIMTTCLACLRAGDHIIASKSLFGSSILLLRDVIGRLGITLTLVDLTELAAWERALKPETRLFFIETPSNPMMEVADIEKLSCLAHDHGCILVVDNVFCTPALQTPLTLGADLVVHSATKYLDGHGRVIGGAVVGRDEGLYQSVYGFVRTAGPSMSPFNAWIFLHGLETLDIRMQAHCDNAENLAKWLQHQAGIKRVIYTGLDTHPQHELASRQQKRFG
ncbi:MAG: aminotransferase class V-fold PLP-dependent enzyme, partial [Gammaproteobacteria bacterium]